MRTHYRKFKEREPKLPVPRAAAIPSLSDPGALAARTGLSFERAFRLWYRDVHEEARRERSDRFGYPGSGDEDLE